jgi:hypothetical protein
VSDSDKAKRGLTVSLSTLGQPNRTNSLIIFDNFKVDPDLPKARQAAQAQVGLKSSKRQKVLAGASSSDGIGSEDDFDFGDTPVTARLATASDFVSDTEPRFIMASPLGGGGLFTNGDMISTSGFPPRLPWWRRLWAYLFRRSTPPAPKTPQAVEVPVLQVFERIKADAAEITAWNLRQEELTRQVDNAQANGQVELVKKLQQEWGRMQFENALYAKGLRRCLTEAQMLEFVGGCERGLCLDWVGNYVHAIPDEARATKLACDEALLFDNYVILHYDPNQKATTKAARDAETAKRRDPILFGVVKGVRKLYFVADWVDEHCNLQFDDLVKALGKPLELPDVAVDVHQ